MASHYKWYPGSEEVVVPWNARYSFPSQANKAVKLTPRIPPKNGSTFSPGQVIRVEFPAQGYVNPLNTTLEFDVCLTGWSSAAQEITRFQNNIQSIFNRVRLLYGATPLEDMINYNVIVRALTEWSATGQQGIMDQETIADGIGGVTLSLGGAQSNAMGYANVRQKYIQGIDSSTQTSVAPFAGTGFGVVPNSYSFSGAATTGTSYCTRRYSVNLALGLFTQSKLIPTKFMASQLAIEISLENADACIFTQPGNTTVSTSIPPTYTVGNVNLIPEILEFDASYDAMFLRGLREGGVPIKFSSWHTFIFSTSGAANINLLVQERSRSVKALFAVQRRAPVSRYSDSHALLFDSSSTNNTLQTYQWRIGGRYFPAAPVQLSTVIGGSICNGGAEAYVELEKALNIVGDYRLSTGCNVLKWAIPVATGTTTIHGSPLTTGFNELDFCCGVYSWTNSCPSTYDITTPNVTSGNSFSGEQGSGCYASAVSLETSNGIEISGLNAEEQSDIAFIANWSAAQQAAFSLEVYSYFDAMIILRENNVLELIQ